jgi:hypothetical protein
MVPGPGFPISIRVAGVPLLPTVLYDVVEVIVDLKKDMPGMFVIRLQDKQTIPMIYDYIDGALPFIIGAPVSISAISAEDSMLASPIPIPLITGEITALEAEYGQDGAVYLVVRGYHKTHRLQRGKKTATNLMMPDNLIVMKVCAAAGVPVTAMPTGGPNEYVLQSNQSDWDFIQERGKRLGFELKTSPLGITTFGPRGIPSGAPALLRYGKNLLSFKPRVNTYGQVSAVTVQGWDPKLKFPIVGMFVVPPTPIGGNTARTVVDLTASKMFGATAKKTIADRPVDNMAIAVLHATAEAKNIISDFVQAEGECEGNPSLVPGSPVMIMDVGVKYTGPYVLSSVTHTYNTIDGYKTAFYVSGSQPETVSGMLETENQKRATGVVIGVVTNNMDPLQMGRVKVRFPHLGSLPPVESNWCRLATASGGMMSGTYFIPDINTEVLVAFEHGDVNFPYIIGTLWNNLDRPPKPTAAVVIGGKVIERIITTAKGHTISLNDMPGKEAITLSDKLGLNSIMLDLTKKSVVIKAMNEVSIDCTIFKLNAKAKVEINALADMSLKSNAMLKMDSTVVKVKGSAMLSLEGAAAELKGAANLSIKGAAGSIMFLGPIVNINNGALEIM